MKVGLALVGCAAFCVGVPPVAAVAPSAVAGDVSPAAASGVSTAAAPMSTAINRKRYTLTMTYTAELQSGGPYQYPCSWSTPIRPATDPVWVCDTSEDEHHEIRTYGATSVKPFTFTRMGKYFKFKTRMKGTSQQVGGGSGWWHHWIGGEGWSNGTWTSGHEAHSKVAGKVYLNGATPARLINEMRAKEDTSSTRTVVMCPETGCTTSTEPFPSGFSDRSWLKRVNLRKAFGNAFTVVDQRTKPPLAINGETIREKWYYRFTPVAEPVKTERWRVEVRGQDRWSWGMYSVLGAGVYVDWAHRTTLVIKNGKITSAKGKVHIVRVRKFSEPPGAFDVTSYKTSTPPAYKLKKAVKRKNSNRVVLGLWKHDRSDVSGGLRRRRCRPGTAGEVARHRGGRSRGHISRGCRPRTDR